MTTATIYSRTPSTWGSLTDDQAIHWGKRSGWTLAEAAMLAHGIDPDTLGDPFAPNQFWPTRPWKKTQILIEDAVDARRLKKMGIYVDSPVRSSEFLEWCHTMDIVVPTLLAATVAKYFPLSPADISVGPHELQKRITELETKLADYEINKKSKSSFLQILFAMASDKRFGHKPGGNSDATSNILSAVEQAGLDVKERTIREWLKEADAFVKDRYS